MKALVTLPARKQPRNRDRPGQGLAGALSWVAEDPRVHRQQRGYRGWVPPHTTVAWPLAPIKEVVAQINKHARLYPTPVCGSQAQP